MKTIEHAIDIAAPAEVVWHVLTDTDRHREWNPFLTMDRPPARVGDRLSITVRAGRRTMAFHPTVTIYEVGHEITWVGHLLVPGLVDGTHTLALEPLPDGGTRFHQRESFGGLLVPFLRTMLRDTRAGFAEMNAALACRCEERITTGQI